MTKLNPRRTRQHLEAFAWQQLFTEELGWLHPDGVHEMTLDVDGVPFVLRPVARIAGIAAFEVQGPSGTIPERETRESVHRAAEPRMREHLLLFTDTARAQTIWSYPVYDGRKLKAARSHHFVKGQPPDLFLSKVQGLTFEIEELGEAGDADLLEATRRLREALDVEQVTKKFYAAFKGEQEALADAHVTGIEAERTRRHYSSVLLTRLMFIYFLQKKGFLDGGDVHYLSRKLDAHREATKGQADAPTFYCRFLQVLFFDGFAKHPHERDAQTNALLGDVRYLNGGLFLRHPIEEAHPDLDVADAAFEGILGVFDRFSWHLDDTPGGQADEINPDVLGYILEKYVNQKAFGAYYTPPELTGYLCDATIDRYLAEKLSDDVEASAALGLPARTFDSLADLLTNLDDARAVRLLGVLGELTVLDPAVGSGAFLVAALKKLLTVYRALLAHAQMSKQPELKAWLARAQDHPSVSYFLKKEVITRNLYGVDLMPEAVEIAKLRLFLALVASAEKAEDLEPLPNIDFNLLDGNSLVGLLDVGEDRILGDMFAAEGFRQALSEKNRLVDLYRGTADAVDRDDSSGALLQIRDQILDAREAAQATLNEALRLEMRELGVEVQDARWTGSRSIYSKRALTSADVNASRPFHWAYEFPRIMERGGFDVIVANPPWDAFKPNDKDWFKHYDPEIKANKMTGKVFEKRKRQLLDERPDLVPVYEEYLSSFPHLNAYLRGTKEYTRQDTIINGKKKGTDLNLYKLFLERSFRLLHPHGHCGIIIPANVYSDLGAKSLRRMLFEETELTGLFGFENSGGVFEDVHRQFKFVILTFEKSGTTERFPTAFMRHDPVELARFPDEGAIELSVDFVKRAAPTSWSLVELQSEVDRHLVVKMVEHPPIGGRDGIRPWFRFGREFHMSGDKELYEDADAPCRLPLIEGKLIHQFDAYYSAPNAWVDESRARAQLRSKRLSRLKKVVRHAGLEVANIPDEPPFRYAYETYRIGFRDVARTTDERTMIAAMLPPRVVCPHTTSLDVAYRERVKDGQIAYNFQDLTNAQRLYVVAVFNSFVADSWFRRFVDKHVSYFIAESFPLPRLTVGHPVFDRLAELAARLVCTTPAFDALAAEMGLGDHNAGATDAAERAALRAEIDARVALLYGLSEEEFTHVLFHDGITGFHRVEAGVREAALAAYRALAPSPEDALIARLIADGESTLVEFKETFAVDNQTGDKHKGVLHGALKTVAAFLNTSGGTLLLGVADDGTVKGLDKDYAHCEAKNPNADGLENKINTTLKDRLVPPPSFGHVEVTFHELEGGTVCRVRVSPSDEPVRLDGDFFVRRGNATHKLTDEEAGRWLKNRSAHKPS